MPPQGKKTIAEKSRKGAMQMAESVAVQAKSSKKKPSKDESSDELSDKSEDSDGSISSAASRDVRVSPPALTRKVQTATKVDKHVALNEEVNMR